MLGKELGELDFSLGLLWYDYMMPHNTQGLILKLFFLYFMEADQQIKYLTPTSVTFPEHWFLWRWIGFVKYWIWYILDMLQITQFCD